MALSSQFPSLLSRLDHFDLSSSLAFLQPHSLLPIQNHIDEMVSHFVEEAANPITLASLTAGGLAYRFGRIGVFASAFQNGAALSPLMSLVSYGVGLGMEVNAFEVTNRLLAHLTGDFSNPNRWQWEGQGGLAQGLASSAITFGMLKGAGFLAREQNLIFQHLFQATAMVTGHNTAGVLGVISRPQGNLAEQFLHAEAAILQLGAGMHLMHSLIPRLGALKSGQKLAHRGFGGFEGLNSARFIQTEAALVMGDASGSSELIAKNPNTFQMSSRDDSINPKSGLWQTVKGLLGVASPFDHEKILEAWRSTIGNFILELQRKQSGRFYFRVSLQVQLDPRTYQIAQLKEINVPPRKAAKFILGVNYLVNENKLEVSMQPLRDGLRSFRRWVDFINRLNGASPIFSRLATSPNQEEIDFHLENYLYANQCFKMMNAGAQTLSLANSLSLTSLASQYFEPFLSVGENGYFVGLQYRISQIISDFTTFYQIGLPKLGDLVKVNYFEFRNTSTNEVLKVPVGFTWESPPNTYQEKAVEIWKRRVEREIQKPGWILKGSLD